MPENIPKIMPIIFPAGPSRIILPAGPPIIVAYFTGQPGETAGLGLHSRTHCMTTTTSDRPTRPSTYARARSRRTRRATRLAARPATAGDGPPGPTRGAAAVAAGG